MSFLIFVVIVVGGVAAIAMVTTSMTRRGRAEAATWPTGPDDGGPRIPPYPGLDQPGGPGAEAMNSDQPGDAMPGPVDAPSPAGADEAVLPSEGSARDQPEDPGSSRA